MEDILSKNLRILEKCQPHVYQKFMLYLKGEYKPRNTDIQRIILAHQDQIVMNMLVVLGDKKYAICDHEDPIGESYGWIDRFIDPSNKTEIVFGMGFGFHLEVLLTSFKNKKVIVIEPNMELFYQILKVRNLELIIEKSEIFVDEEVDLILQRLQELLWDTRKGGIQCQPFYVYAEVFQTLWDELRFKFIKQAESFTVDIATRRYFGDLWVYNNIKNAKLLNKASNAMGLIGSFKDIPAVLVSAGPSLSKNIHFLKEIKDRCIIIAAGSAVAILENQGITPHFMLGVDASKEEGEMHQALKNKDAYFIYTNQVATLSVESYKGPKFFMNYPVDLYTAEFLRFSQIESPFFRSGPSAANTCFDVLYKMGCNPIVLVGQDLAYTGDKANAGDIEGTQFKEESEFEKQGYIREKDIYGNFVYTQTKFLAMRNWFEGYFEKVKDSVEIINATEGGLNIQFAKNDTLENVIRRGGFKPQNLWSRIQQLYHQHDFKDDVLNKLEQYNGFILSEIGKLERYSSEQMKLVELIKKDVYHPAKGKQAFHGIVGRVNSLTDKVMESPVYNSILRNLIEIEFYLIKLEVERATQETENYQEAKEFYIGAITQQNKMLTEKLVRIKELLK
ncbi:MAG: DUF115 domain-containing protein [Clostridia bacterium]|nr:DUF115 domain-containing protein [Clostridia bacterium]